MTSKSLSGQPVPFAGHQNFPNLHIGVPERPPLARRVDVAVRQFELAYEDKGEPIACLEARKHFAWYLRGVAYANYYKEQISGIQKMEDIYRIADGIRKDLK